MNMNDNALKAHVFKAYGGFGDKRIKNLDKSNVFIIDDRKDTDVASDRSLYSYFCMVFARVVGPASVEVDLRGNVPMNAAIRAWIEADQSLYQESYPAHLAIELPLGEEARLEALAELMEAIVRPGAPRYSVASYKYVCPRTAGSLRRFAKVLREYRLV